MEAIEQNKFYSFNMRNISGWIYWWIMTAVYSIGLFCLSVGFLFVLAIFLDVDGSIGFRETAQELAFISEGEWSQGIRTFASGLKHIFTAFFLFVFVVRAVGSKYVESSVFLLLAPISKVYLRVKPHLASVAIKPAWAWTAAVVLGFISLALVVNNFDKPQNQPWPPERIQKIEEKSEVVKMILPDGRIVQGDAAVSIEGNRVVVTFDTPVNWVK